MGKSLILIIWSCLLLLIIACVMFGCKIKAAQGQVDKDYGLELMKDSLIYFKDINSGLCFAKALGGQSGVSYV